MGDVMANFGALKNEGVNAWGLVIVVVHDSLA
jgi:hypothetical protein